MKQNYDIPNFLKVTDITDTDIISIVAQKVIISQSDFQFFDTISISRPLFEGQLFHPQAPKMLLFLAILSFSRHSSRCAVCIINDASDAITPTITFDLISSSTYIVSSTSGSSGYSTYADAIRATINTDPYAKFGMIFYIGNEYALSAEVIDLSIYDVDVEFVSFISHGTLRTGLNTVTAKIRDGQVKNLSVIGIQLSLQTKISLNSLELAVTSAILTPDNVESDVLSILNHMVFCDIDSNSEIQIGQGNVLYTYNFIGAPLEYTVDYSQLHYNSLNLDLNDQSSTSSLSCTIQVTFDQSLTEYPFDILLVEARIVDFITLNFNGLDNMEANNEKPLIFYSDLTLTLNSIPSTFRFSVYSLNGDYLKSQIPYFAEQVYICLNSVPSNFEKSRNVLSIVATSEDKIKDHLLNIVEKETKTIILFSNEDIGSSTSPFNLIGIPSFYSLHFLGDYIEKEDGSIGYTTFYISVDESIIIDNLIIENCTLSASGNTKMEAKNLSVETNGRVENRVNGESGYTDSKHYTNAFESITVNEINLRIFLTSDTEITYDTRGWELTEISDSTIIVLSTSYANANTANFHIYANNNYTITLSLRRNDIRQIKGVEFTIYEGFDRKDLFLSDDASNIHVKFVFSKDTWGDARLDEYTFVFRKYGNVIVDVDESNAPDSFKFQYDDVFGGDGNITTLPDNDNSLNDKNHQNAGNTTIIIILGIIIPLVCISIGILISFYVRKRQKMDTNDEIDQTNDLLLDDTHKEDQN